MKKPVSFENAVSMIPDNATVMVGGFMGIGAPENLLSEIVAQGKEGLTLITSDTARPGVGVGKLIDAGVVANCIASHIGTNSVTQKLMLAGELSVELSPQGTLAERIRAAGHGLGGVLTRTAVGTLAAKENDSIAIDIDGDTYLLERPIRADFALIKAQQADYYGNIQYRLTAQNFNPLMAMAAETVIAEIDELMPVGCIPPDHVHTPGCLIDYIVYGGACDE